MSSSQQTTVVVPRWRPAPRARRLATVACLALVLAFLTSRGELVALAAGPLVLLALGGRLPLPAWITVTADLSTIRCVEGDPVTLTVHANAALDEFAITLVGPPSLTATPSADSSVLDLGAATAASLDTGAATASSATVVASRWGVQPLAIRAHASATSRLRHADFDLDLGTLTVLPRAPRIPVTPAQSALLARLGEHPSRARGSGIEFAGIREYLPGDRIRDLNWAASSRRRRRLVTQRASERAADLVVAVDAFTDLGTAGESSVDRAVRGATALAQAGLRHRDRVGLVVLGGVLRWLAPAGGQLQFYRIAEAVLSARALMSSVVHPDVTRLPRPALPPGSLLVLFSALVDERVFAVVRDLRERRVRTVVVDVSGMPEEGSGSGRGESTDLAWRVWRLDRAADRLALAALGIPVVTWPPDSDSYSSLAPVVRRDRGRPRW